MERRDEFGRLAESDRPYDPDRANFYDRPDGNSSLAWLGGLIATMLLIGGLFYAFTGPSNERLATNATPPTIGRPAPAPTPAPSPVPAR